MAEKVAVRCAEQLVHDPGPWPRWHHCTRRGVVKENGKIWCKQHSPSSVKAREKASHQRWEDRHAAEMAPDRAAKRLRAVNTQLLEALEPLARLVEDTPSDRPDHHTLYDGCFVGITLGDARRARAAIELARKPDTK